MRASVSQLLKSSESCAQQFRLRLWIRSLLCPPMVVYSKAHWETRVKKNTTICVALASKWIPRASQQNSSVRTQMHSSWVTKKKILGIKQLYYRLCRTVRDLPCDQFWCSKYSQMSFLYYLTVLSLSLSQSSVLYMKTDLHHSSRLLAECVVMFKLHRQGLVTVHCCHLHICSVAHVYGTKEICGPEALRIMQTLKYAIHSLTTVQKFGFGKIS